MVTKPTGYGMQRRLSWANASVLVVEGTTVTSPECNIYFDDARSTAIIAIAGEIDMVSTPTLQAAIAEAQATKPDRVIVDATSAEFISVRGYCMIAELSKSVDSVTLCSRSDLAARVMAILGFADVVCVVRQPTDAVSLLLPPDACDLRVGHT